MNTYMSTMSKLLLALCFALFTSVTLMGCGGNDPNVDVQALAEGIGHGDTAAMKDFKLTGDGAKPISEVFIKELGKSLSATQEGMDSAQKIMGDKLKELKIKTEVVSKSDNSAKVKITTDYYNESYGLGKDGIRRENTGRYENQGIQTIFDARRVR